jgi:hypothetical protein
MNTWCKMAIHRGTFGASKRGSGSDSNVIDVPFLDSKRSIGNNQMHFLHVHMVRIMGKKGLVLISWKKLALLKANGRWILKNIFMFSKALTTKKVWHLVHELGLWVQVIKPKYLVIDLVEEWVRNCVKKLQNASIIWKVVLSTFPLVRNWLVRQVQKGDIVQIGLDPWVGSKGFYRFPPQMIRGLRSRGYYTVR